MTVDAPGEAAMQLGMTHTVVEDCGEIVERSLPALRELRGATVVVSGAAGFLASYVVDALVRSNEELTGARCTVVAVDNLVTGDWGRLRHLQGRSDVRFVEADIALGLDIEGTVNYVVHGASIASPTWYRRYPLETIDVNVGGTRSLLELARSHGARLLLLSSSEIYGDPPPESVPTPETYHGNVSPTGPRAPYDESKRLAETLCTSYYRLYGTPVVIVRPFNVYGPRLRLDDGRVIPDFVRQALAGEPVSLLSDGTPTRSFCYVSDFVAAVFLLLVHGTPGEAYNVGNDEEVSIRGVAEIVSDLAGSPGVREEVSSDPDYLTDNPSRRCPDLAKVKAAVEWAPRVSLRSGLMRTLSHYQGVLER